MPFCRKCGRRLVEYSESCPDCKTSTTAPIINTKKASSAHPWVVTRTKVTKAIVPSGAIISVKTLPAEKATIPKYSPKQEIVRIDLLPRKNVVTVTQSAQVKTKKAAPVLHVAKTIAPVKVGIPSKVVTPVNLYPKHEITKNALSPKKDIATPPVSPNKTQKAPAPPETKTITPPKVVIPAIVYPKTEIIKSNVSLKEDILAHPHDYETETFDFNLKCPNDHFWPAGKALPVSNGKAYCLQCGERLSKPKRKKHRRFHRV